MTIKTNNTITAEEAANFLAQESQKQGEIGRQDVQKVLDDTNCLLGVVAVSPAGLQIPIMHVLLPGWSVRCLVVSKLATQE